MVVKSMGRLRNLQTELNSILFCHHSSCVHSSHPREGNPIFSVNMAGTAPILVQEKLLLPSIGIAQEFISFKSVSFESEKFICVRENGAQPTVVSVHLWFADHYLYGWLCVPPFTCAFQCDVSGHHRHVQPLGTSPEADQCGLCAHVFGQKSHCIEGHSSWHLRRQLTGVQPRHENQAESLSDAREC